MLKLMGKKILRFYTQIFCLSKPMVIIQEVHIHTKLQVCKMWNFLQNGSLLDQQVLCVQTDQDLYFFVINALEGFFSHIMSPIFILFLNIYCV